MWTLCCVSSSASQIQRSESLEETTVNQKHYIDSTQHPSRKNFRKRLSKYQSQKNAKLYYKISSFSRIQRYYCNFGHYIKKRKMIKVTIGCYQMVRGRVLAPTYSEATFAHRSHIAAKPCYVWTQPNGLQLVLTVSDCAGTAPSDMVDGNAQLSIHSKMSQQHIE